MKKILLSLLCLFALIGTTAIAQTAYDYDLDESNPLITSVDQLSSPWSAGHDFEGNIAHVIDNDPATYWHTRWTDNTHRHYIQVELEEPVYSLISMKFTRRLNKYNSSELCVADHVTKWGIFGSDEPDSEENDWIELGMFDTPYSAPGEVLNTIGFDTKGKKYLRIYGETTNSGNRWWHVAEIQLYPCTLADPVDAAKRELRDVFFQYEPYETPFKENMGTAPGQYLVEAVEKFCQALQQVRDMDAPGAPDYTAEEIKQMIENIKNSYQAVLDSKLPFTLADGFYRIRGGLVYTNNFPSEEVDEYGDPIIETRQVYKYIYTVMEGEKIYARWGTPFDLEENCPTLFYVSNKDGYFDIVSCATDARFDNCSRSSSLTLSKTSTNLIAADAKANVDGISYVNIRVSTQPADDYVYFHQGGHSSGTGWQGNIVGWCKSYDMDLGPSEWAFDPVSEEKALEIMAAYEPYKNHAVMVENFKKMRDDVSNKLTIAKDLSYKDPLITNVSQLSSPWSAGHDFEGNIAHVIDNDPLTYWHTRWTDNTNRHYIQIELNEPVYNLLCMKFTRRLYKYNSQELCLADHTTSWSFYGSDDPNTEDESWIKLGEAETPYNAPGETIVTNDFDPQGKKYLRIYGESTNSGNRWWHVAEIQLYISPIEVIDPATSQYHMMGEVGTTLDAVYNELKDIDPEEINVDQYDRFKNAYDAFIALYVDPTPLRKKIVEVGDAGSIIELGTDPGFWSDMNSNDALNQAIQDAKSYDVAGVYTTEQSQAHIDNLVAAVSNIKASAIPVQTGRWYRFRFGTEQEYTDHQWNTTGNETDYRMVNGDATVVVNEALFGKYITVARLERVDCEDEIGTFKQNIIVPVDYDDIHMDDQLYCDDLQDIENTDMALFRFISVGDSAYIIQNKATGLYLQKKPESNDGIYLSVHPSFFAQEVVGNGQNALFIHTLSNEAQNPIHIARNTNVVITYGRYGDSDGRRGCYYIEDAGAVESDYEKNTVRMALWEGEMVARCYPVTMQAIDEGQGTMWSVASAVAEEADGDTPAQIKITLFPLGENKAVAGRPFIYIVDGEYLEAEERSDDMEPELIEFTFGDDLVAEPLNDGVLKGSFTYATIGSGVLTISNNKVTRTSLESEKINTNGAYLSDEEEFPRGHKFEIVFDDSIEDGINGVLQKVTKRGGVYTLDGRLISNSGNLNSLRNIQPGIYIVNGVKVVVK